MMAARSTPYTLRVDVLGPRAPRWITAGLVVVLALWLHPVPASAETASFDVGDQAVVAIVDRGRANDITVRTWDRPTVQVESAEGMPAVDRRVAIFGTEKLPLTAPIPPMQYAAGSEGFGGGGGCTSRRCRTTSCASRRNLARTSWSPFPLRPGCCAPRS